MALTLSIEEIIEQSKSPLLAIAPDWKRVRLGDIAAIQNGAPFKSELFNKDGKGMPVIRIRDVGSEGTDTYYSGEYDEAYIVREGDLLIGMDGDFNCARWKGPDALLNQRVCRIIPKTDKYEPRLMDFALPGYLKAINDVTSSVTVKHLSSKTVADILLPLPPLPGQRRIVSAIETQLGRLDAAVARLEGAKARLKRYKQAVLKAAFSEGDHPMTTIGDVYEVFVGSTPSRNKPELWNGAVHWVSSGEVAFCEIHDTRERITEEGLGNRATRLHPPGTVMLAMIGEGKTRGQAAILRVSAAHNQNTAAIRMPAPEYSPEYLYFYFMYEYDNTRRVGGGNNQMALNKSRIQSIEIPMPDPDKQNQIAAEIKERFATVDETEATIDAQIVQAARLRQAVLKRAFEGRLV